MFVFVAASALLDKAFDFFAGTCGVAGIGHVFAAHAMRVAFILVSSFFLADLGDAPAMVQAGWMRNSIDIEPAYSTRFDVTSNLETFTSIAYKFPARSTSRASSACN